MLAVILSRRDWREADQIISFYTRERGKLNVLAKGVKKIISKNSVFLEPGFLVEAELTPGREIWRLTRVYPQEIFKNCRADLSKIQVVSYLLNFFDRHIGFNQPDAELFNLLVNFLYFYNQEKNIQKHLPLAFLLKFFYYSGFRPELTACAVCGSLVNNGVTVNRWRWLPAAGGVVCANNQCGRQFSGANFDFSVSELRLLGEMIKKDWVFLNSCAISAMAYQNIRQAILSFGEYCLATPLAPFFQKG